ncbi:MAG TPA: hypothetical protein VIM56_06310 [Rhizomicrobium sp.]
MKSSDFDLSPEAQAIAAEYRGMIGRLGAVPLAALIGTGLSETQAAMVLANVHLAHGANAACEAVRRGFGREPDYQNFRNVTDLHFANALGRFSA